VIAMSLVGLCVGVLTALSQSPVVSIVIPLLFSLVAGAGGIYISKVDVTQADVRQRLAFAGIGVIAFVVSTLIGVWAIISTQSPRVAPDLTALLRSEFLQPSDQLHLVKLRALAALMGTSTDERREILAKAASHPPQKITTPEEEAQRISSVLHCVKDVIGVASEEHIAKITDQSISMDLKQDLTIFSAAVVIISERLSSLKAGDDTSIPLLDNYLSMLSMRVDELIKAEFSRPSQAKADSTPTESVSFGLSAVPEIMDSLLVLDWALKRTTDSNGTETDADSKSDNSDESDVTLLDLIKILNGDAVASNSAINKFVPHVAREVVGTRSKF
jgi:hypothetical protein